MRSAQMYVRADIRAGTIPREDDDEARSVHAIGNNSNRSHSSQIANAGSESLQFRAI